MTDHPIEVTDVARITYNPDDVIVARLPSGLTSEAAARVKLRLTDVFPDQKILLIDKAMEIDVMTPAEAAQLS